MVHFSHKDRNNKIKRQLMIFSKLPIQMVKDFRTTVHRSRKIHTHVTNQEFSSDRQNLLFFLQTINNTGGGLWTDEFC